MNTKKLINILFPTHDRTSCSDTNIQNGINGFDHHIRCSRCALLSLIKDPTLARHMNDRHLSMELKNE